MKWQKKNNKRKLNQNKIKKIKRKWRPNKNNFYKRYKKHNIIKISLMISVIGYRKSII